MAKKEYVSKYAPKQFVFPREDMTYREFATEKEAQAFKEKCKRISQQCLDKLEISTEYLIGENLKLFLV